MAYLVVHHFSGISLCVMREKGFRGFLLKDTTFGSRNIYKRAILRAQLSLLGISVGIIYTVIDSLNHLYISIPFYLIMIFLCAIVFWMNHEGRYQRANLVFLPVLVFLIYVFAQNDINRTGVNIYFIVYALVALTLCGYEKIRIGIFFSFLALIGFFAAYYLDLPPLISPTKYSETYINISFVTNFIVSLIVTLSLLFFLLDINYKTEQELSMNNQLLSKANRELDRFVYSASHDLRAPLTSLLGLIEISQRTDDQDEIKHCLDMMKVRIADLDSFIKDIIDYSRNTRQEVQTEKFNLLELAKEVSDGLKFGTGMEEIFIRYEIDPALDVETDRSRLKVVLNNIIGNALKYSNPQKNEQLISITANKEIKILKVLIEDNGIGIAAEHLPKIFDMFYRASEKSQGSGLGLYIVKETLDKLNGKIEVTSTVGSGSKFRLEIPILK
jgi:signal transduction histidine kinase